MRVARREHENRVLDKLGHSECLVQIGGATTRLCRICHFQVLRFYVYQLRRGGRGSAAAAAVAHRRTVLIISARKAKFNNTGEGRFSAAPKQAPLSKHPSAHQTGTIEIK
jgi:hypothetical protein